MKLNLVVIAILATFTVPLQAAQPAVKYGGSAVTYNADGPWTLGFSFRVESDITVSALGAYDYLGDGLLSEHTVAIWSIIGGTPLVTAIVPSGTGASLAGHFRYVTVPGLTLSANTEYVIGASDFGLGRETYAINAQGEIIDPAVSFLGPREIPTPPGELAFPYENLVNGFGNFGGNFLFVPVPEPSSYLLLCCGLITLFFVKRYAKNANQAHPTAASRRGYNPRASWPPSLSLGR